MSNSCVKHPMTFGDHLCSECGHHFCRECVVFPFGDDRPGLCISCALERGGVRNRATNWPKLSRKAVRERLRLQAEQREVPIEGTPEVPEGYDEPRKQWLEESSRIEDIPGAWSETYS